MSESHKQHLPTIAAHLEGANLRTWIEPSFGPRGEIPDVLSLAERGVTGLWDGCDLYPGTLVVGDYKHSVADLRHDELKVWRHTQGIGDYRFYWLHKSGNVRPEHVLDDSWWGVIVFDERGWEVVKAPLGFKDTRKLTERLLLSRLVARDAGGGEGRPPSRATRRGPDKLAAKVAEWMGDTPATTGEVKRFLRNGGIKKTPREIDQLLRTHPGITPPESEGGTWSVNTNAAEPAQ